MKKFLCVVCSLIVMLSCFGCGTSFVSKFSKNKTEYTINADFNNEEKKLTVNEKVKYINSTNTELGEICFHIYPRAFCSEVSNKPVSTLNESKAYP